MTCVFVLYCFILLSLSSCACFLVLSVCACACSSHPSRAVHLYISEPSIEIDSSDGMISEASTKDPSSSSEESRSSDDEDGDDSDWGGGYREIKRYTNVKPARKLSLDGTHGICWAETQTRTLLKNRRKTERIFCLKKGYNAVFWRESRFWNGIKSLGSLLLIQSGIGGKKSWIWPAQLKRWKGAVLKLAWLLSKKRQWSCKVGRNLSKSAATCK